MKFIMPLFFLLLTSPLYANFLNGEGSSPLPSYDEEKNVFGTDNRVSLTSSTYPWSAIVKVKVGNSWCTGTFIWKNLVLINAHCVMKNKKLTTKTIWVHPNYKKGRSVEKSYATYVWWGTNDPDKFRRSDWAVIKIKKPLGTKYGYFGWKNMNWSNTQRSWKFNMVGYSNNFRNGETAGVHIGCKIRKKKKNLVYHDCDASKGSSGGPIFANFKKDGKNNYQIVALNASEFRNGGNTSLKRPFYEDKYANVAVRVKRFAQKLKDIREDNP